MKSQNRTALSSAPWHHGVTRYAWMVLAIACAKAQLCYPQA